MTEPSAVDGIREQGSLEDAFAMIKDRTTTRSVASALRNAILEGRVPQGSPLREARIATVMGISRAPLREALSILAEEGLVNKIPYRGAFVASVSEKTVAEMASIRRRLEPFAIELAIPNLVGASRRRVTRALTEMHIAAENGDLTTSIEAHMAFHAAFYDLSNHQMMIDMWRGWQTQLQLFLSTDHRVFENLHTVAEGHEQLLDVIDTHDMPAIIDEVARHVHGPFGVVVDEAATLAGTEPSG